MGGDAVGDVKFTEFAFLDYGFGVGIKGGAELEAWMRGEQAKKHELQHLPTITIPAA